MKGSAVRIRASASLCWTGVLTGMARALDPVDVDNHVNVGAEQPLRPSRFTVVGAPIKARQAAHGDPVNARRLRSLEGASRRSPRLPWRDRRAPSTSAGWASRQGRARAPLHLVNADEFLAAIAGVEGGRESAAEGIGITSARLLAGVEYAVAARGDEPALRAAWRRRKGGGATPLVLAADDPGEQGMLRVLGPADGGPLRRIQAESLFDSVRRTTAMKPLVAVRHIAAEVDRLDGTGLAGLTVRGLGTEHLDGTRLRSSPRWSRLQELSTSVVRAQWREALSRLGYTLEQLPRYGYLVRLGERPVAVVHPKESPAQFARLDDQGRLPKGALLAACQESGVDYGLLVAGTRLRLLATGSEEAGAITRYLDLDTAAFEALCSAPPRSSCTRVPGRGGHGRTARGGARLRPGTA